MNEAAFSIDARITLEAVLRDLPYDEALFFEHAHSDDDAVDLSCVRLFIDRQGVAGRWPQRWQPDLPGKTPWIRGDTPWVDDLDAIADQLVPGSTSRVGELVSVAQLRGRGVRSLIGTAVFDEDDRIAASLILGSKQPGAYRERHRDQLRARETHDAMHKVLARLEENRTDLVREMRKMFVPECAPEEIAARLVEALADATGWDYVGIYRVEDRFALVAGSDRTPGRRMQLDPCYRQDLDQGMLGHTLRARRCLWADDVTIEPPPYDHLRVPGFEARSALCYPILISGNVEWILDCSSLAAGAFNGPDREMLDELISGLQSTLNLWFETRLSRAILDTLSEAVVVTDRDGRIQRSNAAAKALFGASLDAPDCVLLSLVEADDDATRGKLHPSRALRDEDVTLMTAGGPSREMLASARLSSDAFGRYVYKFSAKGELEWLAAMKTAQGAVQGTLAQARGMLMLASAYIDRVHADLRAPGGLERADQHLARIADAIDRADLTYDRLVGSIGNSKPRRSDARVLDSLIDWAGDLLQERLQRGGGPDATARGHGADTRQAVDALKTLATRLISAQRERAAATRASRSGEEAS